MRNLLGNPEFLYDMHRASVCSILLDLLRRAIESWSMTVEKFPIAFKIRQESETKAQACANACGVEKVI